MYWAIRKFGWVAGLALFWLGLIYLPADFLEREGALSVAQRTLTVGNREILLAALCLICLLRLAYLDLRRALGDDDFPRIRSRIWRFIGVLTKRDARQAELKNVADDGELQRLRAEAKSARDAANAQTEQVAEGFRHYLAALQADHKLAIFEEVCPPVEGQPPSPADFKSFFDSNWGNVINDQWRVLKRAFRSGTLVLEQGAEQRIEEAKNVIHPDKTRPEEVEVDWPDHATRIQWLELMAALDQYNAERRRAKESLNAQRGGLSRAVLIEQILRLLPPNTEAETPP